MNKPENNDLIDEINKIFNIIDDDTNCAIDPDIEDLACWGCQSGGYEIR